MVEERSTRWQRCHASRGASEQRGADLVLERSDLPAKGWLRHVKALCRTPHVALLGNSHEIANLRETHAGYSIGRGDFEQGPRADETRPKRYWTSAARARHKPEMAIEILSSDQIERMRRAGRTAAETLAFVGSQLRPGMSTADIDRLVRQDTQRRGGRPSQLGYKGFPGAVCTSLNHVVCHGIPSQRTVLKDGDIINLDVTTDLDGYHGDTSATFMIGEVTAEARRLVGIARRCRDAGIAVIREGARLGDIGAAIAEVARKEGVGVVREFGGHGIGRHMHAEPHVPHTGKRGAGLRLKSGMAITVEPMINLGGAAVECLDDGWTVVTADGSLSAQFEHTVVVTPSGHEILTRL